VSCSKNLKAYVIFALDLLRSFPMTKPFPRLIVLIGLFPTVASAHTGVGDATGFVHGFSHLFGGIDHVLAMVAVGIFAAHLGGRALWLVPISFVTVMAIGGALGMAGVPLPFVEIGIGLSVVALGLAIALQVGLPTLAAMGLVAFFAVFHGHAHGSEMANTASALAYGLGFVAATASLHGIGIGLRLEVGAIGAAPGHRIVQASGGAMALAGVALLAGIL
jgi:urease accessory protein